MLSFSTLGCPDWTLDEILSTAKDLHYDGVEVRGIANQIDATKIPAFSSENAESTKRRLDELGLFIPILSSGAVIGVFDYADAGMKEAKEYINIAARMGIPNVRVLCEKSPHPEDEVDLFLLAGNYKEVLSFAEKKNVNVLLETNGVFSNTVVMGDFFDNIRAANAGIVYDINHPVRYGHEVVKNTVHNIGRYIRHVHIKDSIYQDGTLQYRLCGDGDLPIEECIQLLKQIGYVGYYSLEWVKRWNPSLEAPGIAFPQYKMYMDNILK